MPASTVTAGIQTSSSPDAPHDTGGSVQQGDAGTLLHIRALAVPFKKTSVNQLEDGDLLIKGVPMLAEGTWTDSAVGTPLLYPAKTLEAYAGNWTDTSGWIRHQGGVPRRATDKVAVAENIRYENRAVTADIRVFGFTQMGRDLQELIKRKLISAVSVEHGGDERFNPATRQMEAATLTFTGFAFVNKGACGKCRINEEGVAATSEPVMDKKSESLEGWQENLSEKLSAFLGQKWSDGTQRTVWPLLTFPDRVVYHNDDKYYEVAFVVNADGTITFSAPVEVEQVYVEKKALEMFPGINSKELMALILKNNQEDTMDTKELEAKVEQLTKELEGLKKVQPPAQQPKVEIPKELSDLAGTVKELSAQVVEQGKLIKELAARPVAPVAAPVPGDDQTKELEAPADIPFDRKGRSFEVGDY